MPPRRASPPDWLLEQGLNRGSSPVYVHVGDCWNTGTQLGHRAVAGPARPRGRGQSVPTMPAGQRLRMLDRELSGRS
ncbi:DUF6233 domain-containing protein [Streptomyces sp. NPDC048109]|uniref:DUF6233 domain-containing protein n=1 Tax=unclassified Streptomyces TaxID=2593676 RepID=UPI0033FAE384